MNKELHQQWKASCDHLKRLFTTAATQIDHLYDQEPTSDMSIQKSLIVHWKRTIMIHHILLGMGKMQGLDLLEARYYPEPEP